MLHFCVFARAKRAYVAALTAFNAFFGEKNAPDVNRQERNKKSVRGLAFVAFRKRGDARGT